MTTIMMLALAVVLLLVAVGSLMSYIKERRGYKKTFKKDINGYPLFKKQG
ncbi:MULTISPECIES: small membrane protein [Klebsiella]|nr:small membrane protein [Klebsiella pneumoniae]HBQ6099691.1 small membrane protein [Klebsiella pneumoniae subsp. pneumoniae]HBV3921353.1 small membrane protein [Klebsiella quasipneumoniae]MBD7732831.1 small membrane protein [Klebsiella pneumoniae]MCI8070850.1 small membrane protein [Klebsiella pneumoniae]MCY4773540.1 small membrane protein [Klebsiella pneumoniae]